MNGSTKQRISTRLYWIGPLLVVLMVSGVARSASIDETLPRVGKKPAMLQAIDLSGKPLTLHGYQGKVVLEDFWIIGCPGCTADIPVIRTAYGTYHRKGLEVVGIALDDRHTKAELRAFMRENGMDWREAWDPRGWESPLIRPYHTESLPLTVLIGRDGRICAINVHGPALEAAIRMAMGPARKRTVRSTPATTGSLKAAAR